MRNENHEMPHKTVEEYMLNYSIITPKRNYLKKGEKAGEATETGKHDQDMMKEIQDLFKEGISIITDAEQLEYDKKTKKLYRNGKEVKNQESISIEQYLKKIQKQKEERDGISH